MPSRTAIIIGAGPAGLTAAYELLKRTNVRPVVLESTNMVGGIARTENFKGNRIDIGGHRFFSKSDRVMEWWLDLLPLELGSHSDQAELCYRGQRSSLKTAPNGPHPDQTDEVMLVRNRKSRIFFRRKLFDYPLSLSSRTVRNLGLLDTVAAGISYLKAQWFPQKPEATLEDFLVNRFGRHLYETFFQSYTKKVWGVPCSEISAEWGAQRIKGLSITRLLKHALSHRRAGDLTQRNTETSLIEQFLYPKYGPGQMWELCAKHICDWGGTIHYGSIVQSVKWQGSRVTEVISTDCEGNEQRWQGDFFFSTMPIRDLVRGMSPTPSDEVQAVAAGLVYRDFITVGLLVRKMRPQYGAGNDARYVEDNWIYIQEHEVRVGRLQIFNNWSPYLVADPDTVWLGLEYFCNEGDDLWDLSDDQLGELAVTELSKIALIDAEDVLDFTVIRTPKSYPAYFGSYDQFPVVRSFLDTLENFFPIGRNGMHRYNNQDHSMLTAMTAVDNISQGSHEKANIWAVNTEQSYHEGKQDEAMPQSR